MTTPTRQVGNTRTLRPRFITTEKFPLSFASYELRNLHPTADYRASAQFTNGLGQHILFNHQHHGSKTGQIERYSADYSVRDVGGDGFFRPYQTRGVDQNPKTGTVCFAEYGDYGDAANFRVMRSTDSLNFTEVFSMPVPATVDWSSDEHIRHFHVVAADPGDNDIWYLSSGDHQNHTHFWVSTDDALTWTQIHKANIDIKAVDYCVDATHIYWSKDLGGGGIYRMDKATYTIETLIADGVLDGSGYSFIPVEHGWVSCHSNTTGKRSNVYLIDTSFNHHLLTTIPGSLAGFKSRGVGGNDLFYMHATFDNREGKVAVGQVFEDAGTYYMAFESFDGRNMMTELFSISGQAFAYEHRVNTGAIGSPMTDEFYFGTSSGTVMLMTL